MEISKMLTISTAHVKEQTLMLLACEPNSNRFPYIGVYPKCGYGYFIYINQDGLDSMRKDTTFPDDLMAAIDVAVEADCDILCLDCDGGELETLNTYITN